MPSDLFHCDPARRPILASAGIDNTPAAMEFQGGEEVARSRTTSVVKIEVEGDSIYLKRHFFPTAAGRLKGLFRGTFFGRSKARREFEALERLAAAGFPTPAPLGFGELRRAGFLKGCFLATLGIEGAVRGDAYLRSLGPERARERRAAVKAAARLVAALHDAGYADGSLAPRNLLVRETPGGPQVFKVDCVKGSFGRPRGRAAVLDLCRLEAGARFLLPLRERLRFLKTWAGGTRLRDLRGLLRKIEAGRAGYDAREAPRLAEGASPGPSRPAGRGGPS